MSAPLKTPHQDHCGSLNPNESVLDKLIGIVSRNEALRFCLTTLALAIVIGLTRSHLRSSVGFLALPLVAALFVAWLSYRSAMSGEPIWRLLLKNLTVFPFPYVTKNRSASSHIPWLTYSIIFLMGIIFFGLQMNPSIPKGVWDRLAFYPAEGGSRWAIPALLTHMFLHASLPHYVFNMLFLWVMGAVLERRIGWRKTFLAFVLTGVVSSLLSLITYRVGTGELVEAVGASGAISGLMGLFAVRCYFKTMVMPVPLLGFLSLFIPLQIKIRVNSLTVVTAFFLKDLIGGANQLSGSTESTTDYWAHLWGLVAGILLGWGWNLVDRARQERDRDVLEAASSGSMAGERGIRAAHDILAESGDDPEVYLHVARIKSGAIRTEEGEEAYRKAVELFLKSDPEMAVRAYREYQGKYAMAPLASLAQLRMAQLLSQRGDLDLASRCLEGLLECKDLSEEHRPRVLYQLGSLLHEMGLHEAAEARWKEILRAFPDTPWAAPAARSLRALASG
jgi:membrane associated rhomboid family serine protease